MSGAASGAPDSHRGPAELDGVAGRAGSRQTRRRRFRSAATSRKWEYVGIAGRRRFAGAWHIAVKDQCQADEERQAAGERSDPHRGEAPRRKGHRVNQRRGQDTEVDRLLEDIATKRGS